MTTGAGLATAGSSPGGLGTGTKNTALVSPGYQASQGGCVSSVLIEHGTRDYVYDDYGNEKGMSDTGQRIYMCMRTVKGARINFQDFGFAPPTHINSNIQRDVDRRVRTACKPVTDDGSATITSVEVETEGNQVIAVARWTDNRRQTEETTRAPLAQG